MDRLRGASTTSSFFGVGIGVSVILSIAAFPLFVPAAASSRKWSGLSARPPSRFDERFRELSSRSSPFALSSVTRPR